MKMMRINVLREGRLWVLGAVFDSSPSLGKDGRTISGNDHIACWKPIIEESSPAEVAACLREFARLLDQLETRGTGV